ncbi:mitochondrial substrate carrier family protein [Tieghemostelium lacteum]|uniref:Mitochondrial substrate carrier family protein n=1 Tax=Tieghemostelium lacteum TaxID=361077 RepID=A0A152A2M1_TIELA|nr:mitochondrial substrate carrier family protein [Tieghemostelium lacteum]|eukprot:KYR00355.1 mitochondrial substrate carrier family protein [Tieghemostelium lacteum]
MTDKHESHLMIALKDILAGSIGGVGQVLTGHPLDTIKVRLQTQPVGAPVYSGTMDCLKKTIASEGFWGLYKGVQSPLVGLSIMNSVMFLSYGQSKSFLQELRGNTHKELSVQDLTIAGSMAGFTIAFVEGPVDLFKSQMQVQYGDKKQYNGIMDCAKKIWQTRGIRGIYQGLGPTLIRDVPANGAYFGFYELTRRAFFQNSGKKSLTELESWKVMVAGAVGGVSYWTLTYPIDCVKSLIQTDAINPIERRYSGVIDCAQKIYKQQGISGFYKGFTPCFLRAIPANAACFVLYEKARAIMA